MGVFMNLSEYIDIHTSNGRRKNKKKEKYLFSGGKILVFYGFENQKKKLIRK